VVIHASGFANTSGSSFFLRAITKNSSLGGPPHAAAVKLVFLIALGFQG